MQLLATGQAVAVEGSLKLDKSGQVFIGKETLAEVLSRLTGDSVKNGSSLGNVRLTVQGIPGNGEPEAPEAPASEG